MSALPQLMSSVAMDWRTPPALVDRIAAMLDGIDLDPCADDDHWIPACQHLTAADDCLTTDWPDCRAVYSNPPYGRALPRFVARFLGQYRSSFSEGILLVPARTDTQWFTSCWHAAAICFLRGRLTFVGAAHGAPFPSALVYVGPRPYRFADHFCAIGKVVFP